MYIVYHSATMLKIGPSTFLEDEEDEDEGTSVNVPGGGGGGVHFFFIRRLGPSIYHSPPKYQEFQAPQKII